MLVLAAVPAEQCHKLRRAAAPRFPVVHARDWDDALAIIRTRPVELAAVDPQLEGSPSAREIERLRVLFPSLPLILYTALTPATAAVPLALGHSRIHFLAAARVLYAHRLLQDPGFTIDDVAQRLGYAQTKTLQLHARSYLGLTAGEMRLTLEPREALERIAQGFAPLRQAHASAS